MTHRVLFSTSIVVIALGLTARADTVIVKNREKPLEGSVISEDAKKIVFSFTTGKKKPDEIIPSADIVDIIYSDFFPLDVRNDAYKAAIAADKLTDSEDSAKRTKAVDDAIAKFTESLQKVQKDTVLKRNVARHLEYKLAVLLLKKGSDLATVDRAVVRMQDFVKYHRDSWQINLVMPRLAQIQMDNKDWKEAARTFQEMSEMEVFTPEVRREAKLMLVTVAVRTKDIPLATKRLDVLEKEAGGNPAYTSRVKMARAEVFIGLKQFDDAIPLLREIIKTSADKQTMALAHNALGETLFNDKKYAEARWEFLWVETIYNQDKGQHAKALYYLWKTFDQLNDADRANQCRDLLVNDRQFAGTEYQQKAITQVK